MISLKDSFILHHTTISLQRLLQTYHTTGAVRESHGLQLRETLYSARILFYSSRSISTHIARCQTGRKPRASSHKRRREIWRRPRYLVFKRLLRRLHTFIKQPARPSNEKHSLCPMAMCCSKQQKSCHMTFLFLQYVLAKLDRFLR